MVHKGRREAKPQLAALEIDAMVNPYDMGRRANSDGNGDSSNGDMDSDSFDT